MARLNSRSTYYMHVPKVVFDRVCSLITDEEYNGRVYLTYRGTNIGGEMRLSSSMANADCIDALEAYLRERGYTPNESVGGEKHAGNGRPYHCRGGLI